MPTRAERMQQKENYARKQAKIAKRYGIELKSVKHSAVTCGNADCLMCGNPRKLFSAKTLQEKSFDQTELWVD